MIKHSVSLKDCDVSYFSGTGAGGQHRNKHMNCVRLYHAPSGVRTTAQDHREKRTNEIDALTRLANHPKFRFWAEQELKRLEGQQTIAQWVDEQMRPEHLELVDLAGNPIP
jgi:protein subunit release factor A